MRKSRASSDVEAIFTPMEADEVMADLDHDALEDLS
jgi:hypothetical protein